MNKPFTYLPEDKDAIYRKIAELRQQVEATQDNPSKVNFSWIYNLIHELTTAVTIL